MGFFDKIFGLDLEDVVQPNIPFGRYTDSYKSAAQYDAWDQSLEAFEKKRYLDSYRLFFQYLQDNYINNVRVEEADGQINFELLQGSKKITGYANKKVVRVAAKVVQADDLNIGFMRRLMEENYKMEYGRFALDKDQDIAIVFNTYVLDGSPYKLYYALKEVATKADKMDDLLIEEFDVLHHSDNSIVEQIEPSEKEIKYTFLRRNIEEVIQEIDGGSIKQEKYPGAIAYLLLNLAYKIDYLVIPEGYLMETLERIHRLYFSKDGKNNIQKNIVLYKEFKHLLTRPKEAYYKELYRVTKTFGITKPAAHDRVVSFIDGELHHMDWYWENGHETIAKAIPGYIVGYCLFQFAVPKPVRALFHLYYQVTEADYFRDLGFEYHFVEGQQPNKRVIRKAIRRIIENNKIQYPRFNPELGNLDYTSILGFAKSFLLMIRNSDLTK